MTSQNLQYRTVAGTIAGILIANTAVLFRFLARRAGHLSLHGDDYLIVIALVFHWGIVIGGIIMLINGMGLPTDATSPSRLLVMLKTQYFGGFSYTLTILFTKLSILHMYNRVFDNKAVRLLVFATRVTVVVWALAVCATVAVTCIPVDKIWNPAVPGRCIDLTAFYLGAQIPNILTDTVLLAIPILPISRLDLEQAQKIGLYVVFGLGIMTIIFAIVRLIYLVQLNQSSMHFTLAIVDTSVWTCVEPAVGIFATCLSNMKPLLKYVWDHPSQNRRGKSRGSRTWFVAELRTVGSSST